MNKQNGTPKDTILALLEEKPKRGRPPHPIPRVNVYVALFKEQKEAMSKLANLLPKSLKRADLPDLAIVILDAQMEALRQAVAGRNREMPEGVTDLESLYLLWDLPIVKYNSVARWTSIRVSRQQEIELGRAHGTLNGAFGANRSQTFSLALSLLSRFLQKSQLQQAEWTLKEAKDKARQSVS